MNKPSNQESRRERAAPSPRKLLGRAAADLGLAVLSASSKPPPFQLWKRPLLQAGTPLPLWYQHDVGLALMLPVSQLHILEGQEWRGTRRGWRAVVEEMILARQALFHPGVGGESPLQLAATLGQLASPWATYPERPARYLAEELDLRGLVAPSSLAAPPRSKAWSLAFQRELLANTEAWLTRWDALLLRLGGGVQTRLNSDGRDLAAEHEVWGDPSARRIAELVGELLPEVRRRPQLAQQRSQRQTEGFSGLARRGPPELLLASEWAWQQDVFLQRYAERQQLFLAQTQRHEPPPKRYIFVVDASASMLGAGDVFARTLAIVAASSCLWRGACATWHYFDSQLRPAIPLSQGRVPVASLLAYAGQGLRDISRALTELAAALSRAPYPGDTEIFCLSHGGQSVDPQAVRALAGHGPLNWVGLYGSRMPEAPSYRPLLARHWFVARQGLGSTASLLEVARRILREARV